MCFFPFVNCYHFNNNNPSNFPRKRPGRFNTQSKLLLPVTSRRRALVGILILPHFLKQFEFCLTFSEMIVGSLRKDVFER